MVTTPLILGHRGASALAPENTLAAFSLALSDGADGIEFDVRLSRDEVAVVIHDATLTRTGSLDRRVREMTAAELRASDVGSWFNKREVMHVSSAVSFADQKVPTLNHVFDLFRTTRGLLYLEMKCDAENAMLLAKKVVESIREARIADRVVVESFELSAIAEIKRVDSSIRTAALFDHKPWRPVRTLSRSKLVDIARGHGADEIALHHRLASPRLVEKALAADFEVVVWTVDDSKWIERARAQGIKALIANDPGRLVRLRDRLERQK